MKWNPFSRRNKAPRVAVLRFEGAISAGTTPLRPASLNIETQAPLIERAFRIKRLKAVALVVNSPGGSPVQSALIAARVRALAAEKEVPVFAFAEDAAASGGYWLVCAGDEIYVNDASIVGSIGVIFAGFGFQDLISRYGIERRVHSSGDNKAMLDPFLPERKEDVARLKSAQSDIHQQFIDYVRERRGGKLSPEPEDLFSGAFWTGRRAVELGLADGIGEVRTVMREKYGKDVKFVTVAAKRSFVRSLLGRSRAPVVNGFPAGDLTEGIISAVEERLMWSRYGL